MPYICLLGKPSALITARWPKVMPPRSLWYTSGDDPHAAAVAQLENALISYLVALAGIDLEHRAAEGRTDRGLGKFGLIAGQSRPRFVPFGPQGCLITEACYRLARLVLSIVILRSRTTALLSPWA